MTNLNMPLSHFTSDEHWWKYNGKRYIDDPIAFIEECIMINSRDNGMIPFTLYQFQKDLIEIYEDNEHVSSSCSRQVGMTSINCAYALWRSIFRQDKTIILFEYTLEMRRHSLDILRSMYSSLPTQLKSLIPISSHHRYSMLFCTGSEISVSIIDRDSCRGMNISTLIINHVDHIPNIVWDEFTKSIDPIVSTGGKIILINSVMARPVEVNRWNMFHCKIPWTVVPGRGLEFKEKYVEILGVDSWIAEYGI